MNDQGVVIVLRMFSKSEGICRYIFINGANRRDLLLLYSIRLNYLP
jgi:hypothetical protein